MNEWKLLAPMGVDRRTAAIAHLAGKIYVMGGYNGGFIKSVECYDPTTNKWSSAASMIECRFVPRAGVANGFLYVVGGQTESRTTGESSIERYDPDTNKWTMVKYIIYTEKKTS